MEFPNGDWGSVFVAVFFVLSGFLYANEYLGKYIDIKKFLYKKWKVLFPTFYVAYFIMYFIYIAARGFSTLDLHPEIDNWYFGLTLIGMDGYFLYKIPNYYILGEWFLGAIIYIYILAPALKFLVEKSCILAMLGLLSIYIFEVYNGSLLGDGYRSIVSCTISFVSGMLIYKYQFLDNKIFALISLVTTVVMLFCKLNISVNVGIHITGVTFFITLYWMSKYLVSKRICIEETKFISKVSYAIFLLQHIVILRMQSFYEPTNIWQSALLLLVTIFITVFFIICAISDF